MFAKRLPVVLAFVGGSISSAALLGWWRADTEAVRHAGTPTPHARTPATAPREQAEKNVVPDDEPLAASDPSPIGARARAGDAARRSAGLETPPHESDAEPADLAAETGSSVADALGSLEAAYRRKLADARVAAVEPPASAVAPTPESSSPREDIVAVAPLAVPAKSARPLETAPLVAPPVAAAPAPAARNETLPSPVHVGDVHQNVYNGDVHHGDVHQSQQVAVIQNFQFLPLLPAGSAPAAPSSRPAPTRPAPARRTPTFTFPLTNPDNPWGFSFPPTVLAK